MRTRCSLIMFFYCAVHAYLHNFGIKLQMVILESEKRNTLQ